MIELTSLQDALATLIGVAGPQAIYFKEKSLNRCASSCSCGLIQAFEYNYSLAIALMTRYLQERTALPDKRNLGDFPELIRVADEHQLLRSPFAKWKEFRHARNLTSHTYHRAKADAVAAVAPDFEREVQYLLSQLQEMLSK